MTFTIGSIASGAGMHLHGLKQIGGVPTWAIEMDEAIAHCYIQNHGGKIHIKKVEEVLVQDLEPVDLLIATLSCKNASISKGAKRGEIQADIDAANATAAIIKAIKPKWFMLENVWLYRQFEGFKLIQSTLEELGYYFKFYKFNLRDWGIAQSRDRLYALASRDGSFPDPEVGQGGRGAGGQGWYEAIADIVDQLPETTLAPWQQKKFPELMESVNSCLIPDHSNWTNLVSEGQPALTVRAGHQTFKALIKRVGGGRDSDRLYKGDEPAFTIRAAGRNSSHHSRIADAVVGDKIVAITPRACLRFFGDKQTADSIWLPPTKSLACEVVGNGASWVMFKELFECLSQEQGVGGRVSGVEGRGTAVSRLGQVARDLTKSPHPTPHTPHPANRHHLDFYESPWWFTTELLRYVKLEGVIGEPCVGGGAFGSAVAGGIASLLQVWPYTKQLWTNDIDPNKQADYHYDATLAESWGQFPETDWIITNPPYGENAAPIIKNAYSKARVGVVAFLLTSFLEPCGDRVEFLKQHPPSLVLTFPRYCFRKDKAGKRWSTDNITISCFVWDKRSTSQQLIAIPQSEIIGFYKNPDQAISLSEAQEIIKKIAASTPTDNLTPHTTMQPQPLTRANAKAGTRIIGKHDGVGTIVDNLGFGFVVLWDDGEEITYNWERNDEVVKTFEIAPQSTNEDTIIQFPQAEAIAAQIAQLQAQLNKFQECQANANQLKEQVAAQAQLMLELGVAQQTITDWANRIYFLATGTDVAAMATKSVELAAKLTLLEQDNKALKYQLSNVSAEVEEVKQERDACGNPKGERLLNSVQELESQSQSLPKFAIGERVTTQKGEGVVTSFVYGNPVVKLPNGEFQFNEAELTKTQFQVGDDVRVIKGKHKDKFAVIKEVNDQISCWVEDEFFFHFSPDELEIVAPDPALEPQRKAQEFISKINKNTAWHQIKEVCQGSVEVWREICLHARTKVQKSLIEQSPKLLADYIQQTGDRSDLDWVGDTLRAKVEELLVPKEAVA